MDQEDPSPTILFHEEEGKEEEEEEKVKKEDTAVVSRDWLKLGQAVSSSSDGPSLSAQPPPEFWVRNFAPIGLRVVSPPRRPQSDVWLRLQADPNQ